jgi:hypothetical protein
LDAVFFNSVVVSHQHFNELYCKRNRKEICPWFDVKSHDASPPAPIVFIAGTDYSWQLLVKTLQATESKLLVRCN